MHICLSSLVYFTGLFLCCPVDKKRQIPEDFLFFFYMNVVHVCLVMNRCHPHQNESLTALINIISFSTPLPNGPVRLDRK